jgi:AbrB family looped-hinge helix DNA binding protein
MKSIRVTVSNRGYIVLPASLRKEMDIEPGTKILLSREKNKIILQPVPSFTQKLSGITVKSIGETPEKVEEYLDEQRKDRVK